METKLDRATSVDRVIDSHLDVSLAILQKGGLNDIGGTLQALCCWSPLVTGAGLVGRSPGISTAR